MFVFYLLTFPQQRSIWKLYYGRLILSHLLQAFGGLLRLSKQLWQSQDFGNIATTLTIKRLEAGAESNPHRGRFAGVSGAQEQLQLSHTPLQVCMHTPAPCAFLLTEMVFSVKNCRCCREAFCWHTGEVGGGGGAETVTE